MQGSCIDVMERHVKFGPWRHLGGLRPLVPLPDWADGAESTFKLGLPRPWHCGTINYRHLFVTNLIRAQTFSL